MNGSSTTTTSAGSTSALQQQEKQQQENNAKEYILMCNFWDTKCTLVDCLVYDGLMYATNGLMALAFNLTIILSFCKKNTYRRKYLLVISLAVADGINGFGYLLAGLFRVSYCARGLETMPVSPFFCVQQVYVPFLLLGNQLPISITFLIAVERYYAVTYTMKPATIFNIRKFCKRGVLIAYIFGLVSVGMSYVAGSQVQGMVYRFCFTGWATGEVYSVYNSLFFGFFGVICIIIHSITLRNLKRNIRIGSGYLNSRLDIVRVRRRREVQVTKTMSILIFTTSLCVIFPSVSFILSTITKSFETLRFVYLNTLIAVTSPLYCLNSALPLVIYLFRSASMRSIIRSTCFCCPRLPCCCSPSSTAAKNPSNFPFGSPSTAKRRSLPSAHQNNFKTKISVGAAIRSTEEEQMKHCTAVVSFADQIPCSTTPTPRTPTKTTTINSGPIVIRF